MIGARLLRILRLRWRSLTRRPALDDELDRELSFHLDQLTQERVDLGLPPLEARAAARRLMGNLDAVKTQTRDHRRVMWLEDFGRDVRYAARQLRAHPWFTTLAAGSLAFGLTANAVVLSALRVTFHDPSSTRADRLVVFRAQSPLDGLEHDQASLVEFQAWKTRTTTLESVSASFGGDRDVSADAFGPSVEIATRAVTPDWFTTLDVRPFRGRVFTAADYQPRSGPEVMLISYWFWQSHYGLDGRIVDRTVRVNGTDTRIVGVLSPDFAYESRQVQAWFPLRLDPHTPAGNGRLFRVVGLRRPGASLADTRADVERASASIADHLPKTLDWRPSVVPLIDSELGWARRPLGGLELAAGLLLFVACANVGGLLLARHAARRREFAMRTAFGATRGRLVRQVVAESALLSTCAGAVGIVAAWPAVRVLAAIVSPPLDAARLILHVDFPLAGIMVALMLIVTIAVGVVPVMAGTARSSISSTSTGPANGYPRPRFRMRGVPIAVQIAAAVVLLVSATLVVQSFWRLSHRNLGFDQRQLLLFQIRASGTTPRGELARVQESLAHVPGVSGVGGVSDWWFTALAVPRVSIEAGAAATPSTFRPESFIVTPGFFGAMRAPLASGREFDAADNGDAPWSILVNQEAARLLWPGQNPIGKTLTLDAPEERPRIVVGVVRDMPLHREDLTVTPMIYTSFLQQPPYRRPAIGVGQAARMTFVVRYRAGTKDVALKAQQQIEALGLGLPFISNGEASDLGRLLMEFRNYSVVLSLLAVVVTGLAVMGLYAVMAHVVTDRRREIAIHLALGAARWDVIKVVGGEAMAIAGIGLAIGSAGIPVLPALIASKLWDVGPPYGATTLVVIVVAGAVAAATWVPLRRAIRVDPAVTFRTE